jgi:hypothetical protein
MLGKLGIRGFVTAEATAVRDGVVGYGVEKQTVRAGRFGGRAGNKGLGGRVRGGYGSVIKLTLGMGASHGNQVRERGENRVEKKELKASSEEAWVEVNQENKR